ncbi:hypothetical protein [Candidatus Clavichlamydia salmonicola]|nr:hypothetical protein [Candidatus Clavichlamydia salmonicola]
MSSYRLPPPMQVCGIPDFITGSAVLGFGIFDKIWKTVSIRVEPFCNESL